MFDTPADQTPSKPARSGSRRSRPRKLWRIVLLFLASLFFVDALVGSTGLLEMNRARRERLELEVSIAAMRAENARLRELVQRLKEDPRTIEEIARKELGLIRPGETLFIVKDVPPAAPRP